MTSTDLHTGIPTTATDRPTAAPTGIGADARALGAWARTLPGRLAGWLLRLAVAAWRYAWTVYAVVRLGLLWASFCGNSGLAERRTRSRDGDTKISVHRVPRVKLTEITQHGWRMRVRVRPGQHLGHYLDAAAALRHVARAQAVKPRELWDHPGFLEVSVLRRDPLRRVLERPRQLGTGRIVVGATETGAPLVLDFREQPHWLVSGATDSGKSSLIAAALSALAPTSAVLVSWDLKFGIEAEPFRPRFTDVVTTAAGVTAWCQRLLDLAESRAELLKQLPAGSVSEAEDVHGIHLRRVYVFCDEVAELATKQDETNPDELLRQVLRLVQLCRAMGIHLIVAGQRFGSDLGKTVTSIRAQLGGRICLRVNDEETAKMVLSGLDPEVHQRAMTLPHKGMAIVQRRADWEYARASYQTGPERAAIAARHSDKAISWQQLLADDAAAIAARHSSGTGER